MTDTRRGGRVRESHGAMSFLEALIQAKPPLKPFC